MAPSTIVRYDFGNEKQYYYEFIFHGYLVPGGNTTITTVMFSSTNIQEDAKLLVDPYIPDFIQFMAKKCIEYNASYDGFHNNLVPYSFNESEDISDKINIVIELMQS